MKRTQVSAEKKEEILRQRVGTYKEVAIVTETGETALRGAMARGEIDLPVIKIGSRRVIPMSAVRRLLGIES